MIVKLICIILYLQMKDRKILAFNSFLFTFVQLQEQFLIVLDIDKLVNCFLLMFEIVQQ